VWREIWLDDPPATVVRMRPVLQPNKMKGTISSSKLIAESVSYLHPDKIFKKKHLRLFSVKITYHLESCLMSDITDLTAKILEFQKARDWKQFNTPKDLALSLVLEAAEVMEHFQWKNEEEVKQHIAEHKDELGEELSDVMYWVLLMSHDFDIDIVEAFKNKMKKNEAKYPVEKAKGKNKKYTEL
jgi:NTP pyrophosphatase (non-canonical NTP hydrolase)